MGQSNAKDETISFENALERLEGLVDSLEGGEIALAELIDKYEEGTKLFLNCNRTLTNAELKIEQLRKEAQAELSDNSDNSPES